MADRRRRDYRCEHCGEQLSKTVYYQHKKLYYKKSTRTWLQGGASDATSESLVPSDGDHSTRDFQFSDDEDMQTSSECMLLVSVCVAMLADIDRSCDVLCSFCSELLSYIPPSPTHCIHIHTLQGLALSVVPSDDEYEESSDSGSDFEMDEVRSCSIHCNY